MRKQQINQFLKERKSKTKKVQRYRQKRIKQKFYKQSNISNIEQHQDPESQRKIEFYQRVFEGKEGLTQNKVEDKTKKQQYEENGREIACCERKLGKLKNRKKGFIKKMAEKTNKGQPVMKNYVKYALTKLEETLQKEKLEKKKLKMGEKKKQ